MWNAGLDGLSENCQTEQDVMKLLQDSLLPEGDELYEESLDMVAGGMTGGSAISVVAAAYWDLCVRKKDSAAFSVPQILEALEVCGKFAAAHQGAAYKIMEPLSDLLRAKLTRDALKY